MEGICLCFSNPAGEVRIMERRHSSRIGMHEEASIVTKDGNFSAILENISMGGLFLRTNWPVEIGEKVEISIPMPWNYSERDLTVNVIAVRIMNEGIAFRFDNIDDDTCSALLHLTDGAYV